MIDQTIFPAKSGLVDEALQQQLKDVFARLENPVVIRAVIDPQQEKSRELASFLRAVTALGDQLTLELYGPQEAAEGAPQLDTAWLPVTGLYRGGEYGRVCFHGIPSGREINAFVLAIYNLAGPGQSLSWGQKRAIAGIKKKANIKICVSLACHHCQSVVTACQQIAVLNPNIEAEMIDATLYKDLVERYQIERVPVMIVNDSERHIGGKTLDEIIKLLKNNPLSGKIWQ